MNAKSLFALFALTAVLLSACASQTTIVTQEVRVDEQRQPVSVQTQMVEVVQTVVVEAEAQPIAYPTQGPVAVEVAPTAGPVSSYPQAYPTATPVGPVPTPVDNFFQTYGVNPYEDTLEDHYSTFSLDVDTASYSVARRYVNEGNLPPAEAVRVEEFVNYFDPGYPNPPGVAFGIYADGAPSPFYTDGTYILRFGVQGYQVPEAERQPLSLTFVIDVSGSMSMENRLETVKQSLNLLVDRLRPDDTVGIVVYGTEARVVLYPTNGSDRQTILNAIYGLTTEGSTNAEAGLRLGYQMAMNAYRPGAANRVILCSDGVANVGATGPDAILAEVRGYVEEGIRLTTVGFGMGNFNDVLMEQLADNGDGNYAYVDTLDEAERLFVDNLTATLQVIALDARVQVDFNPDVVARYRLIGYENRAMADQDFRNDAVDAGEIGAGHSATALYAVQFRPGVTGRIATVQLRWQDPTTYQVQEINGNFNTWDLASRFEDASPHYQLAVVVGQYAEVLRNSYWAYGSSLSQVSQYATYVASLLPEDAEVVEFANLVYRASQVRY